MEEERTYTVYMHTAPNNKKYVGITKNKPKDRWAKGKGYKTQIFYRAIEKYGWDNFEHEIILCNLTKQEAEMFEIEMIGYYKSNNKKYGYNIDNGGNATGKISEETKKKISKSVKAGLTPERLKKLSDAHKGQIGRRGYKMSEQTKRNIGNANLGRKVSEETKFKISLKTRGENNNFFGKKHSEESIKKIVEANRKRMRAVENVTTGAVFESLVGAANFYNLRQSGITNACKGFSKTCGGFVWRYI